MRLAFARGGARVIAGVTWRARLERGGWRPFGEPRPGDADCPPEPFDEASDCVVELRGALDERSARGAGEESPTSPAPRKRGGRPKGSRTRRGLGLFGEAAP